jgi:phosphatidylglycerol---prolipoprotein diacylglyceryl transferase
VFPQLFHIGKFAVPTYGVLVATGVMLGLYIAAKLSERQGQDPEKAWNLGILAILCAVVGAKVMLIINDWSWYTSHPSEIVSLGTLQAGGVFYGGLLAALAVSVWYIRRNQMPVLRTCDAFAPGIAIGHAVGRLGCFAAGCCFGKPTSLPWGVTFTNPLANYYSGTPLGVRLQPTQLYESLAELINFLILLTLFRNKKFEGQVIGAYMFLYGVERFFIEFVRGDPDRGSVFGGLMTGTQFISILLVLAGGLIWLWRRPLAKPATVAHAAR